MGSNKQHIAASGAKAGQWVNCIAQQNCRLGGLHVEKNTLVEVQAWAGRRAWVDLTQQDYQDYLESKIAGTLEQTKRPLESLEDKRNRVASDDGRITKAPSERKKQSNVKFREAEALKGTIPESEYYAKLYEDFPDAVALPLADQRKIEKILNDKFNSRYGTVHQKKIIQLREWAKNGNLKNPDRIYASEKARKENLLTVETLSGDEVAKRLKEKVLEHERDEARTKRVSRRSVQEREDWQTAMAAMELLNKQQLQQKMSAPPRVAPVAKIDTTRIPDYAELNPDSPATNIVLKQLQSYEIPGQGSFGSKTKEDKLVEYMVRNQLVFTSSGDFEKIPAASYAHNIKGKVETAYNTMETLHRMKRVSKGAALRNARKEAERYVEQDAHNRTLQKGVHDSFVQASKSQLSTLLFKKGYETEDIVKQVASAEKASEIYKLTEIVERLPQQDEFTRAGL